MRIGIGSCSLAKIAAQNFFRADLGIDNGTEKTCYAKEIIYTELYS